MHLMIENVSTSKPWWTHCPCRSWSPCFYRWHCYQKTKTTLEKKLIFVHLKSHWLVTFIPAWTGDSGCGWLSLVSGWLFGSESVIGEGIACIGLPGDSGLFITAESATLVVAVMGRCGIAIGTGAVCSCDTPLAGEISLKGTVEFSDWKEEG